MGVGLTSFGGCALLYDLLYDAGLPGCLWRPSAWNSFSAGFFVGAGRGPPPPENRQRRQRHLLTPCLVVCAGTIIGTGWVPPD